MKAHGEHFFPIPIPAWGFNPHRDPHPRISLEVLADDDGEVGDDGLGVEGELPERGPVLAEQLVDQRLLGGAGGAIGGSGGCVRFGVPWRQRLREARLLGATGVGAHGGSAGGGFLGDSGGGGAHDRRVGRERAAS